MTSDVQASAIVLAGRISDAIERDVTTSYDPSTLTYFLRPDTGPEDRMATLRVSVEAFEDWSVDEIFDDLRKEGVLGRLETEPEFWPLYSNSRSISPLERRTVSVDGDQYTVLRDRERNVRIVGPDGELLKSHPKGPLRLPMSAFRRPLSKWQAEIRSWR